MEEEIWLNTLPLKMVGGIQFKYNLELQTEGLIQMDNQLLRMEEEVLQKLPQSQMAGEIQLNTLPL